MKAMSEKKEIIYEDDPRAATKKMVELWVPRGGNYGYRDEKYARYLGATHKKCEECGAPMGIKTGYVICDKCRLKAKKKKWEDAPSRPIAEKDCCYYSDLLDKYLDDDDLSDWCDENGVGDTDAACKALLLYHTVETQLNTIDVDYITEEALYDSGFTTEDILDEETLALIDKLNDKLQNTHTHTYEPTGIKVCKKMEGSDE
jgi:hypothetical protein